MKTDVIKTRWVNAARISYLSVSTFVILLTLLHFLKPELDPSWHFISEYQLGDFGWVMFIAFIAWGISCITLAISLWSEARNFGGRLGLVLLFISALGMFIAALFETDPLNAPETVNGKVHQLGATLNLVPFAAIFVCINLIRKNDTWRSSRSLLVWITILVWVGELSFIGSMMMYFPADGKFGPDVLVGWPGRLMIAGECAWILLMAKKSDDYLHAAKSING